MHLRYAPGLSRMSTPASCGGDRQLALVTSRVQPPFSTRVCACENENLGSAPPAVGGRRPSRSGFCRSAPRCGPEGRGALVAAPRLGIAVRHDHCLLTGVGSARYGSGSAPQPSRDGDPQRARAPGQPYWTAIATRSPPRSPSAPAGSTPEHDHPPRYRRRANISSTTRSRCRPGSSMSSAMIRWSTPNTDRRIARSHHYRSRHPGRSRTFRRGPAGSSISPSLPPWLGSVAGRHFDAPGNNRGERLSDHPSPPECLPADDIASTSSSGGAGSSPADQLRLDGRGMEALHLLAAEIGRVAAASATCSPAQSAGADPRTRGPTIALAGLREALKLRLNVPQPQHLLALLATIAARTGHPTPMPCSATRHRRRVGALVRSAPRPRPGRPFVAHGDLRGAQACCGPGPGLLGGTGPTPPSCGPNRSWYARPGPAPDAGPRPGGARRARWVRPLTRA